MSKWYLTADTHLGGKTMPPNRRDMFATKQQHDNLILTNLISVIKPIDTLFIIGDCISGMDGLEMIDSIVCAKKVLLMGNHCHEKIKTRVLHNTFSTVMGAYSKRNLWWSHIPIHPNHFRGRVGNIHGHLHTERVLLPNGTIDPRYYNVGVDLHDYKPLTFEQLSINTGWYKDEKENTSILP